jgi:hypothetical protein
MRIVNIRKKFKFVNVAILLPERSWRCILAGRAICLSAAAPLAGKLILCQTENIVVSLYPHQPSRAGLAILGKDLPCPLP